MHKVGSYVRPARATTVRAHWIFFEYFRDVHVHVAVGVGVAPNLCLRWPRLPHPHAFCPPATFLMTRATACLAPRFVLFIVVATGAAAATVIYTYCLFYANLMQHSHSLTHSYSHSHSLALTHCRKEKKTNEPRFDRRFQVCEWVCLLPFPPSLPLSLPLTHPLSLCLALCVWLWHKIFDILSRSRSEWSAAVAITSTSASASTARATTIEQA